MTDTPDTPEQMDAHDNDIILGLLMDARACRSPTEWRRVEVKATRLLKISDTAAYRLLWGLATGYRQAPLGVQPRGQEPLTWGEGHCLDLYRRSIANRPRPEGLANLSACLGLHPSQVQAMLESKVAAGRRGLVS